MISLMRFSWTANTFCLIVASAVAPLCLAAWGVSAPSLALGQPNDLHSQQASVSLPSKQDARPGKVNIEREYYTVCMNLIQREWEANHVGRVLELLEDTKSSPYRGWEWGYWNRLCHSDVKTIPHSAFAVAVSPDGKQIALGQSEGKVILCDAATGREFWSAQETPVQGRRGWITTLAFTPDGKRLASCDSESTTVVWDVRTGEAQSTLFGAYSGTYAAFSADASHIILNFRGSWGAIRDLATGKDTLTNPEKQYDMFHSIALAPNGKRFATANSDNTVRIWDSEKGAFLCATSSRSRPFEALAFSPDGKHLTAACQDSSVSVFEVETGKEVYTLAGHGTVSSAVRYSPDGRHIAIAGVNGVVRLLLAENGKEVQTLKGHTAGVQAIAFAPNGKFLVSGGSDGATKVWNLVEEPPIAREKPTEQRPQPANQAIHQLLRGLTYALRVISPNGKYLAVASMRQCDVWDIALGKKLSSFDEQGGRALAIAFSADSALIAFGRGDGDIKVVEIASGRQIQTLKGLHGAVTALAFLKGHDEIVAANSDGAAVIWNVAARRERLTLRGHNTGLNSVRFFPDGGYIATGDQKGIVRLWDSISGKCVGGMQGVPIGWMTLSSDGTRAVIDYPYSLRLWNLKSGQEIRTLPYLSGLSHAIAFSPDRKRLLTGISNRDNTGAVFSDFQIWDADTGALLLTMPTLSRQVRSARFSPDGTWVHVDFIDGSTEVFRADI